MSFTNCVFFLILILFTQSIYTQRCTGTDNSDPPRTISTEVCGTFGKEQQYCDTTDKVCKATTQIATDGTATFSSNHQQESCNGGFKNPSGTSANQKCELYAFHGCAVEYQTHVSYNTGGVRGHIRCGTKGSFTAPNPPNADDDGRCVFNENIDTVNENDYCGFVKDGRMQTCGHNLMCSSDSKCVKRSSVGGVCGTTFSSCQHGLICVRHRCVQAYSMAIGEPCENPNANDPACSTGYCGSGGTCHPTPSSQKTCWRNVDCQSADGGTESACVGASDAAPGKCLNVYHTARSNWLSCVSSKCNQVSTGGGDSNFWTYDRLQDCMTSGVEEPTTPDASGQTKEVVKTHYCTREYARYMCTKYCTRAADLRYPLQEGGESFAHRGDIPFKFDCKDLTVTKLTASDCRISSFFSNCEAIAEYPSAATSLGVSSIVAFVSIVLALIFM